MDLNISENQKLGNTNVKGFENFLASLEENVNGK